MYNSAIASILLTLLVGCGASKPLQLELNYSSDNRSTNNGIGECSEVFYFSDQRKNKTLGQMSGQAVLADTAIYSWINQAFMHEFGNEIKLIKLSPKVNQNVKWVIELKKAYVMNQTTNMAATSVFKLRKTSKAFKQVFRGNITHSNWNSSTAETIKVLNSALRDGLGRMKESLSTICRGENLV